MKFHLKNLWSSKCPTLRRKLTNTFLLWLVSDEAIQSIGRGSGSSTP